jgi:hypothetical protein
VPAPNLHLVVAADLARETVAAALARAGYASAVPAVFLTQRSTRVRSARRPRCRVRPGDA